jgi:hypothetical protein
MLSALAIAALAFAPMSAEARSHKSFKDIPVSGPVLENQMLTGQNFNGVMTIYGFYHEDGQLWAAGVVNGMINGMPVATAARAPVTGGTGMGIMQQHRGSCQILFLEIGPIYLDLLGLVVQVDQITIEIEAQRGPGRLLGNLLCAVAGLLDGVGGGGGPLTPLLNQLVTLLNQIIDLL